MTYRTQIALVILRDSMAASSRNMAAIASTLAALTRPVSGGFIETIVVLFQE